jgi:hypothetical protein
MPIRADLRQFYGREWVTVTRPRILARAGDKCEQCGKPNHAQVDTLTEAYDRMPRVRVYVMYWKRPRMKRWYSHRGELVRPGTPHRASPARQIRVVLTVAHLNHTPGDDRDENLAALCQWCHLIYDLLQHRESRQARKDKARPLLAGVQNGISDWRPLGP